MKIYISADIEGVTGTTHWDETDRKNLDFKEFQEQMTAEVVASCEGALEAGASEIWVKDAHDTARNIIASKLPREVKLVRGWSGHPFFMVQDLDETFHAVVLIGYHSPAGSDANPLAHTGSRSLAQVKINDRYASELLLKAYTAALVRVPIVFVSGDDGICKEAELLNPNILTVAVKQGVGNSTVNIHPHLAVETIRESVHMALEADVSGCRIQMPEFFSVEITYKDHADAYRAAFFPGTSLKAPHKIQFETKDYFEVMRLLLFVT